jgi:hypothetical protein
MILYQAVMDINESVTEHSRTIDEVELKLLEVNQMRKKRREKKD